MKHLLVVLCLAALAGVSQAKADNIQTIGQYSGPSYDDPIPSSAQVPVVIGTFDILAGDTSITISGTFGNSVFPSSSGVELYLGSVLVATCVEFAPCYEDLTIMPWSYTLTAADIATLGTGSVDFTADQISQYYVQLGVTTLDQAPGTPGTPPVPEPSSLLLLGTGLLGCVGAVRRRLAV